MKKKFLSFLGILLLPLFGFPQGKLFSIWEDPLTFDYWFVSLDAASGIKTNISIIPSMTAFVGGNCTAFDTDSMHYIFRGMSGAQSRLYTMDAITGQVLYSPLLNSNVIGLHYDCYSRRIYGMKIPGSAYELVSVSPYDGTDSLIASLSGFSVYLAETFSYNPHSQLFSFVIHTGAGFFLRSYNVINGTLMYNSPFNDNIVAHNYSCPDSALFGLWEDGGTYKFERIDESTGGHTTVSVLNGITPGFVSESSCITPAGNFIYRGFDSSNNFSLISINAASGNLLNVVNTNDNSVGFETGMCCTPVNPTGITRLMDSFGIQVYPNPVDQFAVVSLFEKQDDAQLVLINSMGIPVRTCSFDGKKIIYFERNGLPSGIYSIVVYKDKVPYKRTKVILE